MALEARFQTTCPEVCGRLCTITPRNRYHQVLLHCNIRLHRTHELVSVVTVLMLVWQGAYCVRTKYQRADLTPERPNSPRLRFCAPGLPSSRATQGD
ncbi:hypothetical protein BD309DRAFT_162093 [Dichomitus squalens]|nr:hypothetical protein BD309DRAFT_162093 [Dichomitus squalens]